MGTRWGKSVVCDALSRPIDIAVAELAGWVGFCDPEAASFFRHAIRPMGVTESLATNHNGEEK